MESNSDNFHHSTSRKTRIIKAVDVPIHIDAGNVLQRARILSEELENQAQEKARGILENAEKEAQLIIDNARAEGAEQAALIIQEQRTTAEKEAAEYILDLTSDLQNQLKHLDNHLIALVETALQKIIGDIGETDKIEKAVSQGLQELKDQYGLILLVHASQFDAAQVAISRFHSFVGHDKGPIHRVEIDADLSPGDCFIRSSGGLLDISFKTQIENIIEGLLLRQQGDD